MRDEDRIEFRIRFVVEFMEVRDSQFLIRRSQRSMYRYPLSKFTAFSLSICGDLDLEV